MVVFQANTLFLHFITFKVEKNKLVHFAAEACVLDFVSVSHKQLRAQILAFVHI